MYPYFKFTFLFLSCSFAQVCTHIKKKKQLKVLLKIQIRPLISWTGATGSQQTENVNYCRYVVIEKKLLFCNNRISVCPQFQHSNE